MNHTQLVAAYINAAKRNIRRESKFYNEDLDALITGAKRKTVAELHESLARIRAIAMVSQAEIRVHCQF